MKFGALCVLRFTFLLLLLFYFLFFIFLFLLEAHSCGTLTCQQVLCTIHRTHYSLNVHTFHWNGTINGSRILFTGPTNIFITKTLIKMSIMVLFIYLKIILLQYFQFSIFNFQQNKRYSNKPLRFQLLLSVYAFHLFPC